MGRKGEWTVLDIYSHLAQGVTLWRYYSQVTPAGSLKLVMFCHAVL